MILFQRSNLWDSDARYRIFVGLPIYAVDVILLAPSRAALQEMLKVTEKFAQGKNILLSQPSPSACGSMGSPLTTILLHCN